MSKILVCRCEDVTLADIDSAIDAGNEDIESLKRYTGFGTGVCQGKSCTVHVARRLNEREVGLTLVEPFTPRPPVMPIPMRLLAGEIVRCPPDYPLEEAEGGQEDEP